MSDFRVRPSDLDMPMAKIPSMKADNKAKLEKAAKQFEGLFMDIVMKSMRESVNTVGSEFNTEEVKFFQGMLDSEFAKITTSKRGIGLADVMVKQLSAKFGMDKDKETKKT